MNNQRSNPTFVGRSDAELQRILAERCVECGQKHAVAKEPAEWSLLEMREISALDQVTRDSLISFRKLDPAKQHFICGSCFYLLTEE